MANLILYGTPAPREEPGGAPRHQWEAHGETAHPTHADPGPRISEAPGSANPNGTQPARQNFDGLGQTI